MFSFTPMLNFCMLFYLLAVLFPVFHKALHYEVSQSRGVYEKLIGAVMGRFDHSKPSLVGISKGSSSIDHVNADEDVPTMYILCFSYISLGKAEKELRSREVKFDHYYSSYSKDLGCLHVLLGEKEKSALLYNTSSEDVQCNLILPLGNMRKVENSLLIGLVYLYQTALAAKSQGNWVILREMEKDHIIAHHLANRLKADENGNTQEIMTPMQITIGIDRMNSSKRYFDEAELHRKYIDRWLSREYLELRSHRSKFLDFKVAKHHYEQAYGHENHDVYKNLRSHKEFKGPRRLIDSIVYLSSLHPYVNDVRSYQRESHYGIDRNDNNSHCDFSMLQFVSHDSRIDVKLTSDGMKGVKNVICLFHFIRAVSGDPVVSMMSLSPSIRLLNYHARCIIQSGTYNSEPWYVLFLSSLLVLLLTNFLYVLQVHARSGR